MAKIICIRLFFLWQVGSIIYFERGGLQVGFLFNQVFWGVLLIVFGVALVVKVLFNINIPMFRIFFAFFLIYIGIWFLIGGKFGWQQQGNSVIFNESSIAINQSPGGEYNVIFGKGTMDLSRITLDTGVSRMKLNTIFGAAVVQINPDIPLKIIINSPFAAAKMPDGNNVTFGSNYTYQTKSYQEGQDYLLIHADVVFGALEVVEGRPL